ncbi:aquaporin NIP6-1 isoform X3 [Vigna radiata var. radiata]|uniref:Aquaporin NIP6-1 isoform X3 n=1 Tax=Vigna radiata var. radiata TaxID=3916 RepID=A0A1S3U5W7_VIGRR|nr:aquaporin NIP6-1 isoform X3 [Vigna radiata var. radiata]XP_022636909.1 aquaporin NIP6-1 isoform X3 [Vigna radiata var. radiata]
MQEFQKQKVRSYTELQIISATAAAIVNEKTNGSETIIGCAATTGLVVMVVIFATGHISGAHFNPAVTLSFAALKHFPWKHVPIYIGAQVLASICAAFALKWVYHPFMIGGVTVPSGGYGQSFVLEFVIAFNLMFVVTAVTTDTRAVGELAGIAVGATVMFNIMIAGPISGASMNPVRTLGPAIATKNYKAIWVYLIAPIFGALAGAGTYSAVKLPKEDDAKEKTSISFRK